MKPENPAEPFKRAVATEGSFMETVRDSTGRSLGLNLKILPDGFIAPAISVVNLLKETGLSVQELDVSDLSLHELDVVLDNGPKLYFSLDFPADKGVAEVIASFKAKPGFKNMRYLDFRVQNKLYYQ